MTGDISGAISILAAESRLKIGISRGDNVRKLSARYTFIIARLFTTFLHDERKLCKLLC